MAIVTFPPVSDADEDGLLAIGGDLDVSSLLLAYSNGIFLWPPYDALLAWFAPPERAILFIDEFHVSKSFKKELKRHKFEIKTDTNFTEVMRHCAELKNRKKQRGTWISEEIIEAYTRLHRAGGAHSIETFLNGKLVGGVYGVAIGSMFAAESMFYRHPNASKVALHKLLDILAARGSRWVDFQVLNPFTEKIGARNIPRSEFMQLLRDAIKGPALF